MTPAEKRLLIAIARFLRAFQKQVWRVDPRVADELEASILDVEEQ